MCIGFVSVQLEGTDIFEETIGLEAFYSNIDIDAIVAIQQKTTSVKITISNRSTPCYSTLRPDNSFLSREPSKSRVGQKVNSPSRKVIIRVTHLIKFK